MTSPVVGMTSPVAFRQQLAFDFLAHMPVGYNFSHCMLSYRSYRSRCSGNERGRSSTARAAHGFDGSRDYDKNPNGDGQ